MPADWDGRGAGRNGRICGGWWTWSGGSPGSARASPWEMKHLEAAVRKLEDRAEDEPIGLDQVRGLVWLMGHAKSIKWWDGGGKVTWPDLAAAAGPLRILPRARGRSSHWPGWYQSPGPDPWGPPGYSPPSPAAVPERTRAGLHLGYQDDRPDIAAAAHNLDAIPGFPILSGHNHPGRPYQPSDLTSRVSELATGNPATTVIISICLTAPISAWRSTATTARTSLLIPAAGDVVHTPGGQLISAPPLTLSRRPGLSPRPGQDGGWWHIPHDPAQPITHHPGTHTDATRVLAAGRAAAVQPAGSLAPLHPAQPAPARAPASSRPAPATPSALGPGTTREEIARATWPMREDTGPSGSQPEEIELGEIGSASLDWATQLERVTDWPQPRCPRTGGRPARSAGPAGGRTGRAHRGGYLVTAGWRRRW